MKENSSAHAHKIGHVLRRGVRRCILTCGGGIIRFLLGWTSLTELAPFQCGSAGDSGAGDRTLEGRGEEGSRLEGMTAAYLRQTVGVAERYVATSGELVVTESSPDCMAGRSGSRPLSPA